MRLSGVLLAAALAFGQVKSPSLVGGVQPAAQAGDFSRANQLLSAYRATKGITPEYILALSWIGRGQLAQSHLDLADDNAHEVRKLVEAELQHRKLDAEPQLPTALGASIEVEAQVLAKRNARDQAVLLLRDEMKRWQGTSIQLRLQKNLNLLTLEGKPAPPVDIAQWIGEVRPKPLSEHAGHPVLLFLWAHWCPDCKKEVEVLQSLMAVYGPRGLELIAPTQHYGYIAGGEPAAPSVEAKYIATVFRTYYRGLGSIEVPLGEATFERYGVSTTPTIVLIDRKGLVTLYNPGAMALSELSECVEKTIAR